MTKQDTIILIVFGILVTIAALNIDGLMVI
jgi:hypothetical protein